MARQNSKARRRRLVERQDLERVDAGERRRLGPQAPDEPVPSGGRAPDPDQHALGVVPDLAREAAVPGESPGMRPEAHSLDQAADTDRLAPRRGAGRPARFESERQDGPQCCLRSRPSDILRIL